MADQTKTNQSDAIEASAKAADAVTDAVKDGAKTVAKAARSTAAKPKARTAKRRAAKVAKPAKRRVAARKATRTVRKTIRTAAGTAAAANQGFDTIMKNNNPYFAFDSIPAFAPFQSMIEQANERSQDFARKGQKVAEQMADLTRANVEAIVEASRVAAEGARSIGQDFVAKGRDNVEQASDTIRSLAEAKSPTEYMQLQGEFARAQFDRFVADSSKLTETMVKLAGEAFQPLQNRAAANAQRFNTLVA